MSRNTDTQDRKPKSPSREEIMAAATASLARVCWAGDRLPIEQAHAQGYVTARDCVGAVGFGGLCLNSIGNLLYRKHQDGQMDRVELFPRGVAYRPRKQVATLD
jgi:hypothetical protein